MRPVPLAYRLRAILGSSLRRKMRNTRERFLHSIEKDCRGVQRALLTDLLHLNSESAFSVDYKLKPGLTLQDFRRQVPVSDYELVRPYINRVAAGEHAALLGSKNRLHMFAVTSGTTAESKLIPVTTRFLDDYRRGWQMWGIGTYSEHAALQSLNIVQISSSHRKFSAADSTPCGNISGLVATMQNPIVKTLYTIPAGVAEIQDAETRRRIIVRLALADPFIGMFITANPSTLVQLMEFATTHVEELIEEIHAGGPGAANLSAEVRRTLNSRLQPKPARAAELRQVIHHHGRFQAQSCWPRMGVLGVWCGGSAAAYIPRLKELFGQIPVRDHGLHASEGRMTLPLRDDTASGVLEAGTHFFEFLPLGEASSESPIVLEAHELQEGQEYFILMTTSSGLYRYNIRDVVRCTGFYGTTPILEFRHKGSHISSITGEKITESQVVESVDVASIRVGVRARLFTLTPAWSEPPGYTLYLDHPGITLTDEKAALLAAAFDSELQSRNLEYLEKRETGRLRCVRAEILPQELWRQFATSRQSRAGGSPEQYKHPCLVPDPQFENVFLNACRSTS